MIAANILEAANNHRMKNGELPVAIGAVANELLNIEIVRQSYNASEEGSMLEFVHAFNCLNDFNMICHIVGRHVDHFPGGESLENKILIVHKWLKGSGRGGALFKHLFCWALLDWKAKPKEVVAS